MANKTKNQLLVEKYLAEYFSSQSFNHDDLEYRTLVNLLNAKDVEKTKLVSEAHEAYKWIESHYSKLEIEMPACFENLIKIISDTSESQQWIISNSEKNKYFSGYFLGLPCWREEDKAQLFYSKDNAINKAINLKKMYGVTGISVEPKFL